VRIPMILPLNSQWTKLPVVSMIDVDVEVSKGTAAVLNFKRSTRHNYEASSQYRSTFFPQLNANCLPPWAVIAFRWSIVLLIRSNRCNRLSSSKIPAMRRSVMRIFSLTAVDATIAPTLVQEECVRRPSRDPS
jgi:hypothetical protein